MPIIWAGISGESQEITGSSPLWRDSLLFNGDVPDTTCGEPYIGYGHTPRILHNYPRASGNISRVNDAWLGNSGNNIILFDNQALQDNSEKAHEKCLEEQCGKDKVLKLQFMDISDLKNLPKWDTDDY
ncbi:hypothetical protein OCU04_004624 [Sclerotinia nivalis]|uniref:Uncharacterized protein n=1 Tax=Sclerotinia nivalis TaxID=352851 RepID=A0A9X0DML8_9HELO|nr:hypothetical protein OCU04_004624 [Sclerotinia nivalis]